MAFEMSFGTNGAQTRLGAPWPQTRRGTWIAIPLVAAAYFSVASMSLLLAIPPGYASAVWPPAGIALAAWLAFGSRIWPGIWIGAALANLGVIGTPPATALAIGAGNTAEAALAALLFQRFVLVQHRFEHAGSVWSFVLIAFGASLVAATNGVLTLALSGQVPWAEFGTHWTTWWLGDATGIVITTPLLLCWSEPAAARPGGRRRIEYQLFAALLALCAALISAGNYARESVQTLAYLTLPLVAWAASRLDQRAVTAASFAISAVAVIDMADGDAIMFAPLSLNTSLLLLQLFVSAVAVAGLILSARSAQAERMRAQLEESHADLKRRLGERSAELQRCENERASLARRIVEIRDEERQRLAAELHDSIAQDLTSLAVSLDLMREQPPAASDGHLAGALEHAMALARRAGESVRDVMVGLRPPGAEEPWLSKALRSHAAEFEERTGIVVTVTAVPAAARIEPLIREALLRIYLEALANVRKHADARSVRVALELKPEQVQLRIADDGRGFDAGSTPQRQGSPALGLTIMQERARALGGEVRVRSSPGAGTRVEVSIPV
jgi:signal transduction histidine kinase